MEMGLDRTLVFLTGEQTDASHLLNPRGVYKLFGRKTQVTVGHFFLVRSNLGPPLFRRRLNPFVDLWNTSHMVDLLLTFMRRFSYRIVSDVVDQMDLRLIRANLACSF